MLENVPMLDMGSNPISCLTVTVKTRRLLQNASGDTINFAEIMLVAQFVEIFNKD